ncbi:HAD-IA family hydrolase [bacterium]|nr:HAD-IA family hydrolase [candidate division CSSED10-310 bacterium]
MSVFNDIQSILFDLDGTLTDYDAGSEAGLRAALKIFNEGQERKLDWDTFREAYNAVIEAEAAWSSRTGFKVPARENRIRRFRILFDGLGLTPGSLLSDMADAYGAGRSTGTRLYAEVHTVLQRLQTKYKLAILSEGSSQTQMVQIEAQKIKEYFTAIIISDQTPWHKPDELLFRFASMKIETEPENILMVGDRLDWDIKPAREIGMKTVFLNRARISEDDDRIDLYADKVIYNLQEILVML